MRAKGPMVERDEIEGNRLMARDESRPKRPREKDTKQLCWSLVETSLGYTQPRAGIVCNTVAKLCTLRRGSQFLY